MSSQPYRELSPTARQRAIARCYANVYQRRGHLVPPARCERCRRRPPEEKHHEDYNAPLDVRWYCHRCHQAVERERRTR